MCCKQVRTHQRLTSALEHVTHILGWARHLHIPTNKAKVICLFNTLQAQEITSIKD